MARAAGGGRGPQTMLTLITEKLQNQSLDDLARKSFDAGLVSCPPPAQGRRLSCSLKTALRTVWCVGTWPVKPGFSPSFSVAVWSAQHHFWNDCPLFVVGHVASCAPVCARAALAAALPCVSHGHTPTLVAGWSGSWIQGGFALCPAPLLAMHLHCPAGLPGLWRRRWTGTEPLRVWWGWPALAGARGFSILGQCSEATVSVRASGPEGARLAGPGSRRHAAQRPPPVGAWTSPPPLPAWLHQNPGS